MTADETRVRFDARRAQWAPPVRPLAPSVLAGCIIASAAASAGFGAPAAEDEESPPPPASDNAAATETMPASWLITDQGKSRVPYPAPYHTLRPAEDWSFLDDPLTRPGRSNPFDRLKRIPLDEAGAWRLTLGGEFRLQYENYDGFAWGARPDDEDGYFLQRAMFHTDLRYDERLRLFTEFKSGLAFDHALGPFPADENEFDVHQAFVDVAFPASGDLGAVFRGGRQELQFGSGRLLSNRDGPNMRIAFDALRWSLHPAEWTVDAFVGRRVADEGGAFDDDSADGDVIWGVYATAPVPVGDRASVDLYSIGFDAEGRRTNVGPRDEVRHTHGLRFFGRRQRFDWNVEGIFQHGTAEELDILAWSVGSEWGVTLQSAAPEGLAVPARLYLRANVISGDRSPDDDELNTFNPLYPRGGYFGEIGAIGPANLINLHPGITLPLTDRLGMAADLSWYWRYSDDDGLYNNAGSLIRSDTGTDARYVGYQPSVELSWTPNPQARLRLILSRLTAGDFIEDTGPADDVDFAFLEFRFVF